MIRYRPMENENPIEDCPNLGHDCSYSYYQCPDFDCVCYTEGMGVMEDWYCWECDRGGENHG